MVRFLIYVLDVVFIFVMSWIVSHILRYVMGSRKPRTSEQSTFRTRSRQEIHGETARDPVCGMFVSTELPHRLVRDGKILHFCSLECQKKFQMEADRS